MPTDRSRRTVLKLATGTGSLALLAGCLGDDDTGSTGDGNGEQNGNDGDETDGGNETDDGDNNGDGNGNGDENGDDGNGDDNGGDSGDERFEIDPGTTIEFEGLIGGWVGIAPEEIADEENPTLVLQEGETYEIGWSEGDGARHNIEIRNGDGEVVDDLATETTTQTDPTDQWLTFEATAEMVEYVCYLHAAQMSGDIEVE